MLLVASVATSASAAKKPDLRLLLSKTPHRIFLGRIAGVAFHPGPVTTVSASGDADLVNAVLYWLRVGNEYEARLGIRLSSADDLVRLKSENKLDFIEQEAWANIAIAKAAGGDYKGGAQMLELSLLLFHRPAQPHLRGVETAFGMEADAVALRIQQAEADGDVRTLLDALIPLRYPQTAEACFNNALILEKLGLNQAAVRNYSRSLVQRDDNGWNEETSRRINQLSQASRHDQWPKAHARLEEAARTGNVAPVPEIVRSFPDFVRTAAERELLPQWARGVLLGSPLRNLLDLHVARTIGTVLRDSFGDALLADSVLAIDESIQNNDARRLESLARAHLLYAQARDAAGFETARRAFDEAGSPMANAAEYFAITTQFDVVPIDQSLPRLSQLERKIGPAHRGLHAMVNAAIGHCLAERGDFDQALDLYTSSQHVFETDGEPDGVTTMRVFAAHMLSLMGHPVEAWRVRKPALHMADESGDPALVEFVMGRTASDELFNREELRAIALYGSVLTLPPLYASPEPGSYGNHWRNPAPLPSMRTMLDALAGRPLPPTVQNDVRLAQAISLCQRRPEEAEKLLSQSIDFAEATGRVAMLPYVYFYRGIARREAKREDDAIHDLNHAISLLESRRRTIKRADLRNLWFRVADDPFHELMNLYWSRGDDEAAFAFGERRRGLVFMDGITAATDAVESLTAEQISKRLGFGTAVIVFTASPRYMLATLVEKDRVVMRHLPKNTGYFLERKRSLRTAIEKDRSPDIDSIAEELYDTMIAPLAINRARVQRVVIVADQPLHDLPFAVLRDRKSGQYLIEQFELIRVASASVYAQTKSAPLASLDTVLAIGDPAFDRSACPSCPALPAARAEVLAVAQQYPRSRTLVGEDATFDQIAANISTADVIHVGAHTVPSIEERQVLNLLLAPSPGHAGTCSVSEAAGLPLKKGSTVVVAGCQTAISREPGTLRDFAGAFLAAGARNVVATLWDVEDDSSRSFAAAFHRTLRKSGNASTAARAAQIAMLRSSDPHRHSPRAWSGFQVFSVGS